MKTECEGDFEKQLKELINACCMELPSNTPDFILAKYMNGCLNAFNDAIKQRDIWYKPADSTSPDIAPLTGRG